MFGGNLDLKVWAMLWVSSDIYDMWYSFSSGVLERTHFQKKSKDPFLTT